MQFEWSAALTSRLISRKAASEVEDAPGADAFFELDDAEEPAVFAVSLTSLSDIVLALFRCALSFLKWAHRYAKL